MDKNEEFNQHLIQLIIGLQTTAWIALGKQMNPQTGEQEVNLDLARDSIDTLLMLKEKTKGNTTQAEETIFTNAMQDLELNFIEVTKEEEKKAKSEEKKEENKEEDKKDVIEKSEGKKEESKEKKHL